MSVSLRRDEGAAILLQDNVVKAPAIESPYMARALVKWTARITSFLLPSHAKPSAPWTRIKSTSRQAIARAGLCLGLERPAPARVASARRKTRYPSSMWILVSA